MLVTKWVTMITSHVHALLTLRDDSQMPIAQFTALVGPVQASRPNCAESALHLFCRKWAEGDAAPLLFCRLQATKGGDVSIEVVVFRDELEGEMKLLNSADNRHSFDVDVSVVFAEKGRWSGVDRALGGFLPGAFVLHFTANGSVSLTVNDDDSVPLLPSLRRYIRSGKSGEQHLHNRV